jgi:HEPN domain-containing protein
MRHFDVCVFYAYQAVEKALKALHIVRLRRAAPHRRNNVELAEKAGQICVVQEVIREGVHVLGRVSQPEQVSDL